MLRVFFTNPLRPWQGYFEAWRIKCCFFLLPGARSIAECACVGWGGEFSLLSFSPPSLALSLAFPFHTLDSCCWLAGCWCVSQRNASNFSKHELLLLWIASERAHTRETCWEQFYLILLHRTFIIMFTFAWSIVTSQATRLPGPRFSSAANSHYCGCRQHCWRVKCRHIQERIDM